MAMEENIESTIQGSSERVRSLAAERKAQMADMDQALDDTLGSAPTTPSNPHGECDAN